MSYFPRSNTLSMQSGRVPYNDFNAQDDQYTWLGDYGLGFGPVSFDAIWPRSRGLGGGGSYDTDTLIPPTQAWFNWPIADSGSRSCLVINGVTRDGNGNPLANCTVDALTTSDNLLQNTVLSANDGTFSISTYRTDAHFLVAYKATSPSNLAGSTDINLTPG